MNHVYHVSNGPVIIGATASSLCIGRRSLPTKFAGRSNTNEILQKYIAEKLARKKRTIECYTTLKGELAVSITDNRNYLLIVILSDNHLSCIACRHERRLGWMALGQQVISIDISDPAMIPRLEQIAAEQVVKNYSAFVCSCLIATSGALVGLYLAQSNWLMASLVSAIALVLALASRAMKISGRAFTTIARYWIEMHIRTANKPWPRCNQTRQALEIQ